MGTLQSRKRHIVSADCCVLLCQWLLQICGLLLQAVHGRADDQVAAEALANHTRCNNSYVYDLFQALYKSSLTCPHCYRQSNTFDPFLSVSLPIPQRSKKAIFVTVVYLDAHPKQVNLGDTAIFGSNWWQVMTINDCKIKLPVMWLYSWFPSYWSFGAKSDSRKDCPSH